LALSLQAQLCLYSVKNVEPRSAFLYCVRKKVSGIETLLYQQRKANGVDVSIDAEALEGMSEEELRRKYEQGSRGGAGVPGGREDFSDLVARESAKRKKQEKERDQRRAKDKDFKF
jgi:hypothetical protein